MAKTALKGNPIDLVGEIPAVGSKLVDAEFTGTNLGDVKLSSFEGVRVLNIFPSIDTGVCATSVRKFNEQAAGKEGVTVLNISADLPFAMARFCGAEGIENTVQLSTFRSTALTDFGLVQKNGPLAGLAARVVLVLDGDGIVRYTELVPEITQEPNYDAALAALK